MLFTRRPAIVLTLFAACVLAITPPVSAGCLCDWLFGRQPAYAATMPVTPLPAYGAAMPVTPAYSAAMPIAPAYSAAMPVMPAYNAAMPATTQTAYQVPTAAPTPQYAAQMPAYGAAAPLPSGYAGQYSSLYGGGAPQATVPVASVPVATAAPITSYYGSGNVYPPIQTTSGYTANYAPNYTANYTALQPVPVRTGGLFGGIRGFFGNLFGTNYRTSYYRAPVTYYRPMTTVDPASGTTVTVQRPCTAYQYQVQRAPYIGLQPAAATPAGSCATGGCTSAAPYAPAVTYPSTVPYTQSAPLSPNGAAAPSSEGYVPQPTLPPASFDPYSSQRTTYSATPGYPATPGYSAAPAPLTGSPSTTPMPSSAPAAGDYAPVAPPAMETRRLPQTDDTPSSRYWPAPPSGSVPEPPSTYARPIPAPPATWSQPQTAPAAAPTTGRTASRPAWGFKKISWNASDAGGIQQAGYQGGGAERDLHEENLRVDSVDAYRRESYEATGRQPAMMLNAPQQIDAARPRLRNSSTSDSGRTAPSHSEYDNSGWRSAR